VQTALTALPPPVNGFLKRSRLLAGLL
jgi:hypothetical protein